MDSEKNTNFQSAKPASGSQASDMRGAAGEALAKISDVAQQAGGEAKRSVTALASEAQKGVKGLLNDQVAAGAELVSHVAESAQLAADNLDKTAPAVAGLVRSAAAKMEEFSEDIKGQSVDELWRGAMDLARERPALAFGAAAAAGFVLYRLATATAVGAMPAADDFARQGATRHGAMQQAG